MRVIPAIPWWHRIFPGSRRTYWLNILQQQRSLLHCGLLSEAEVLHAVHLGERVGNLYPVRLYIRLRLRDDRFIYTHCQTMINCLRDIEKGSIIKLRFDPSDLTVIMILSN